MGTTFRIFRKSISASPEHTNNIIKGIQILNMRSFKHTILNLLLLLACVALHNFLRTEDIISSENAYCPVGYADDGDEDNGSWRANGDINAFRNITSLSSNMHSRAAGKMRDELAHYFTNEGSVDWQRKNVGLE